MTTLVERPETEKPAVEEQWAIIELMGRNTMAGRITEEVRFGGAIGRCDIPQASGDCVTCYFNSSNIYRMTMCTEPVARRYLGVAVPKPVALLTQRESVEDGCMGDDDDEGNESESFDNVFAPEDYD